MLDDRNLQYEINAVKEDIKELKEESKKHTSDISGINRDVIINTQRIETIQTSLAEIRGDTSWLRRTITGAIITALIGGAISFVFFLMQKI